MSLQIFQAVNPADGQVFGSEYPENTETEVRATIARAAATKDAFAALSLRSRAALLESIADQVEKSRVDLIAIAHLETGLPEPRII